MVSVRVGLERQTRMSVAQLNGRPRKRGHAEPALQHDDWLALTYAVDVQPQATNLNEATDVMKTVAVTPATDAFVERAHARDHNEESNHYCDGLNDD